MGIDFEDCNRSIGKAIVADIGEGKKMYVVADVMNDLKCFDNRIPEGTVFGTSSQASANNLANFGISFRERPGIPEK